MFRFANPLSFLLLSAVAAAAWRAYRRNARAGLVFSAVDKLPANPATWRTRASRILPALYVAGLTLATFALARPQTVLSKTRRSSDVIAIEMITDVSGSMEALDLSIKTATGMKTRTRLDAVKEAFGEFVKRRPADLIGLVTFGGYATTRVPLTLDHSAVLHVLEGVEIPRQTIAKDGQVVNQEELLTAVGDALATACARLRHAETKTRIAVLLSDGESNTGIIKPDEAAKAARELGIKVYTIGVGSNGQAPFMVDHPMMGRTVQYANVTLDEKLLKQLAKTTGGRYFNVQDPKGLENALKEIDKLEKTRIEQDVFSQFTELFPWFLGPAVCMIAVGAVLNAALARRIV